VLAIKFGTASLPSLDSGVVLTNRFPIQTEGHVN
jgi:hypothetical protein